MLEQAKQKALEVLKNWMFETPISSEEVITVGEYGYAVLVNEEEAGLLYEAIGWQDDETDDYYYVCGADCPEIGEHGGLQLITLCDGEYGLDEGIYLIVNYNEL